MAGGGAVRNHGYGQVRGVGGVVHDLDVEDGGEAAQPLGADAELVHLFVEFDAEGSSMKGLEGPRAMRSCMSMGSMRDSLAITIAFSAVPPMPMPSMPGRAPAGSHGGDGFQDPIDYGVGGVEHGELALGFASRRLWRRR